MKEEVLRLRLRSQAIETNERSYTVWKTSEQSVSWSARQTGLILCDVWDNHSFRGAVERLEAMIPRMNDVVKSLRTKEGHIIHAPSDTMSFYESSPARKRIRDLEQVAPPPDLELDDPVLPFDASKNGSDTGEKKSSRNWTRQNKGIEVDESRDVISDVGTEVYSYLKQTGIKQLLIMGVHTTMCILHRSFAIKQMVRSGIPIVLIRDLTDCIYNPERPPYVSHEEGTQLAIGYIEKFWCPSVDSADIVGTWVRA